MQLQLHISLNACMSIIAKGKIIKNKKCSHCLRYAKFDLLFNFVSNSMTLKSITPIMIIIQSFLSFPSVECFLVKYISSNCSKTYSFKDVLILRENINSEANWSPKLLENKNSKVYMVYGLDGAVKIQTLNAYSKIFDKLC